VGAGHPFNRHHFFLAVLLFACFSASGCDALYRLLHKEGAEEKEIIGEVLPLERNPTIQEVQALLDIYGYDPGVSDGVLGHRTRDAIKRFQEDNGLEPTRFVDTNTWQKLKFFVNNGFIVDEALNVTQLQSALKAAGYNPGPIDGKIGAKTKEAIIAFQGNHSLKVDGKVGFKTLTALSQYVAPPPPSLSSQDTATP
jgi:peptidoglycan hydrolase-like protein with peptidoglycan-binding domain